MLIMIQVVFIVLLLNITQYLTNATEPIILRYTEPERIYEDEPNYCYVNYYMEFEKFKFSKISGKYYETHTAEGLTRSPITKINLEFKFPLNLDIEKFYFSFDDGKEIEKYYPEYLCKIQPKCIGYNSKYTDWWFIFAKSYNPTNPQEGPAKGGYIYADSNGMIMELNDKVNTVQDFSTDTKRINDMLNIHISSAFNYNEKLIRECAECPDEYHVNFKTSECNENMYAQTWYHDTIYRKKDNSIYQKHLDYRHSHSKYLITVNTENGDGYHYAYFFFIYY
ncbi:hypothetical protein DLAC_06779 [Tieghemostelium lacteum]|uniref:Uncharacterized protein n=1 Tax=Tieghemostelium lacteum TaxID=361077 RepID=A0A151ZDD1_TIELA|nr:hypothetical protein DLAC_06779 [Tieghemostelium lacteum]|eukprot:KYQ91963.1 hypothetical protein DLAC_06779 [Tieghemostelium lacteum]